MNRYHKEEIKTAISVQTGEVRLACPICEGSQPKTLSANAETPFDQTDCRPDEVSAMAEKEKATGGRTGDQGKEKSKFLLKSISFRSLQEAHAVNSQMSEGWLSILEEKTMLEKETATGGTSGDHSEKEHAD